MKESGHCFINHGSWGAVPKEIFEHRLKYVKYRTIFEVCDLLFCYEQGVYIFYIINIFILINLLTPWYLWTYTWVTLQYMSLLTHNTVYFNF